MTAEVILWAMVMVVSLTSITLCLLMWHWEDKQKAIERGIRGSTDYLDRNTNRSKDL